MEIVLAGIVPFAGEIDAERGLLQKILRSTVDGELFLG